MEAEVRESLFHLSCNLWRIIICKHLNFRRLLPSEHSIMHCNMPYTATNHDPKSDQHLLTNNTGPLRSNLPATRSANNALRLLLSKDEDEEEEVFTAPANPPQTATATRPEDM